MGMPAAEQYQFAFRKTEKFDLLEAYGSYMIPLGSGLTLKAGKFVTLLGYVLVILVECSIVSRAAWS